MPLVYVVKFRYVSVPRESVLAQVVLPRQIFERRLLIPLLPYCSSWMKHITVIMPANDYMIDLGTHYISHLSAMVVNLQSWTAGSTHLQILQTPLYRTSTTQISVAQNISQVSMHKDLLWLDTKRLSLRDQTARASHPQNLLFSAMI